MLLLCPAVYSVENLHNNEVREGSTSTGIERLRVTKWSAKTLESNKDGSVHMVLLLFNKIYLSSVITMSYYATCYVCKSHHSLPRARSKYSIRVPLSMEQTFKGPTINPKDMDSLK